MGGGGSETTYNPPYPLMYHQLLKGLTPELSEKLSLGAPSSATIPKQMYESFLGSGAQMGLPPEYSNIINKMVTTGMPYTGKIEESPYYAAAYPAFQKELANSLGQAKEASSMGGSYTGSGGDFYLGKAAADTTSNFVKDVAGKSLEDYNAIVARMMSGLPYAFQESALPYDQISAMMKASQATELGQEPWLTYLLPTLLGKGGDMAVSQESSPWASLGGLGSGAGGLLLGLAATGLFCFIVDELYNLETKEGKLLFTRVNWIWPQTYLGKIMNRLYRSYSKPISLFIKKKGLINKIVRSSLKLFFNVQLYLERRRLNGYNCLQEA